MYTRTRFGSSSDPGLPSAATSSCRRDGGQLHPLPTLPGRAQRLAPAAHPARRPRQDDAVAAAARSGARRTGDRVAQAVRGRRLRRGPAARALPLLRDRADRAAGGADVGDVAVGDTRQRADERGARVHRVRRVRRGARPRARHVPRVAQLRAARRACADDGDHVGAAHLRAVGDERRDDAGARPRRRAALVQAARRLRVGEDVAGGRRPAVQHGLHVAHRRRHPIPRRRRRQRAFVGLDTLPRCLLRQLARMPALPPAVPPRGLGRAPL